jgi:hypothetical protein
LNANTKSIVVLSLAVIADISLVFNRVWLDELPRKPQQTFNTFIAATEERIGLFHMDYCLELTGASRSVKRYRSMEGWEIGPTARPEQLLDKIASITRAAN